MKKAREYAAELAAGADPIALITKIQIDTLENAIERVGRMPRFISCDVCEEEVYAADVGEVTDTLRHIMPNAV